MKVTRSSRARDLIIVDARIFGVRDAQSVSLAIDTGSVETVVTPAIVDDLGYSPRHGERITTVRVGLTFLDQLNYEVRSKEGRICVERALEAA